MGKIYDALKKAEQEAKLLRETNGVPNKEDTGNTKQTVQKEPEDNVLCEQEELHNIPTDSKTTRLTQLQLVHENIPSSKNKVKSFPLLNIFKSKNQLPHEEKPYNFFTDDKKYYIAAEQYRLLRAKVINFNKETNNLRKILVTSALPSEGKSTVSSNLAICIASGINHSALLIDCDMRKPTIHKFFGFNNRNGLSNFLQNDCTLDQAILKTGIEQLSILPAGTLPSNPSELIASKKMIDLIETIHSKCDASYIIFDSPPIHQTSEATILSKHIDGIILVVKSGSTSREIVKSAVESLDKKKIIGIVFNMTSEKLRNYQYNYYYSQEQK